MPPTSRKGTNYSIKYYRITVDIKTLEREREREREGETKGGRERGQVRSRFPHIKGKNNLESRS